MSGSNKSNRSVENHEECTGDFLSSGFLSEMPVADTPYTYNRIYKKYDACTCGKVVKQKNIWYLAVLTKSNGKFTVDKIDDALCVATVEVTCQGGMNKENFNTVALRALKVISTM